MPLEDLLKACARGGDPDAWLEFVRRFHGIIAAVAIRTARQWGETSPALIDDLVQETYLSLCRERERMLGAFQERHADSFYAYLKVVTSNVVHDHYRAIYSQKRGGNKESELDGLSGGHEPIARSGGSDDIQRNILLQQVDAALRSSVSGENQARDRQIFWLYYRHGMTAQAIANLPAMSLNVKGVESLLHRLTRVVRERLANKPHF